jgi:branched-chain amino acid aminotransferase
MCAAKADWIWMNGEFVPWAEAKLHVYTEAVLRGENVFEGIRGYWNGDQEELYIFKTAEHLRRLRQSCMVLRMQPSYSDEELSEVFRELLRRNNFRETVHFRPVVYFGEGEMGATDPDKILSGVFVLAVPSPHKDNIWTGQRSCISTWRRNSELASPPRVKAGANYHNSRLASVEAAKNGFDTPIMLNDRGKIAESPGSCFFMVKDGIPTTAPVTSDILESITRATLIQLFKDELGLQVAQREIDRTEVYLAEEAFFCGSGAEVAPIISVDHYPLGDGKVGPITKKIQKLYFDIAEGRVEKYRHWLTPVYEKVAVAVR